jgi:taurine-pyruvate aminotransferase
MRSARCDLRLEQEESLSSRRLARLPSGGGIIVPHDDYMRTMKDICEKSGALLIVDEVICGFGRTGKRFGYQH